MNTKPFPTNNQEAFNNVWRHFIIEKNPKAVDPLNISTCRYRIEIDGKMCGCAIGCQLPDYMYKPEFENNTIHALINGIEDGIKKQISIPNVDINLLKDLQYWHDWTFSDIEHLKNIAKKFELTIPTI